MRFDVSSVTTSGRGCVDSAAGAYEALLEESIAVESFVCDMI